LYINGNEVSDGFLLPGWSDYHQRAYYQGFDVTQSILDGENCVGAIVTEGWYAGYVGYGLLVGYGPNKSGKNFYGKTPSLFVQIEIEYTDGSRDTIVTNSTWQVTSDGPIREADIIMGESFDARNVDPLWCASPQEFLELSRVRDIWSWVPAVESSQNGSVKALYSDTLGDREVELGFRKPPVMQSHPGVPVKVVQELPANKITEPQPGVYIFDLGQNFAGVVRLKTQGANGQKIQLRYGEMLHSDGRLMTENLRRARATDNYVCAGTGAPEQWVPQFTYHGFQYVEVTGLSTSPDLDTVTGLVLTSDTKYDSTFSCSDHVMTKFWQNGRWTQMANFIDIPTDCPQRDERLGWMGDAQAYVRTASYNADVAAFFTKWLDDVREAQRDSGAYPDYAPYPMAHGLPGATHGTAWTDAGIICPWTIWKVYGDTRVIRRQWQSMCRFMDWRVAADPQLRGVKLGNTWGDWLNVGEETPIEYIDLCYHAHDCQLMVQLADALGESKFAEIYRDRLSTLRASFRDQYLEHDSTLRIETQTAHVLALSCGLFVDKREITLTVNRLAARINANETRMATGFLGTKSLLPVLTSAGQHDLACRLFQSRRFPSWGYEAENGATSVWERWDSYTQKFGFDGVSGKNNAAMNSFSHYAFGAVMEWAYRDLAGIDSDGPGYQNIVFRPGVPTVASQNIDPNVPTLHWVKARYAHPRGTILSEWSRANGLLTIRVALPPNTTGTIYLPKGKGQSIQESGTTLVKASGVNVISVDDELVTAEVSSGTYRFDVR
ncbi:MAG: family 78 glycoside hydrolase catalytic domain, partial [Planctomycetota bacterium]|nr:family 78 glycoside hydrolase catalytic domain [Planctomycetota bacterium]